MKTATHTLSMTYVLSPLFGPNYDIFGLKQGLNVNFDYFNPQRFEPCVISLILIYRASRYVKGYDLAV